MTDIASLKMQIDSSQALTGAQALDKMTESGKMSEEALDRARVASLKAADAFRLQGEKIAGASAETQKILNRYDPLGTKLRQLQTDFANLDKAIRDNAVGGTSDLALDKAMRTLNEEISRTKGLMREAGAAVEGGATSMEHLHFGSMRAQQSLMHLGREVMHGDFAMMPATLVRTAMHMGALSLLLNPLVLGVVALGAAAAAMGVAMVKGAKEQEEMNAAIAKTGDYAGQTRGTMRLLAQEVTDFGHVTIGTAKEIVTSLVGSGRIGAEAIGAVSRLTEGYANTIGKDVAKALPDLIKLFDDPAKGAAELNKTMHELSPTFLEHIRQLQATGEKAQAQRELAEALLPLLAKQKEELGYISTALNIAAKAWSGFWDEAMGWGRAKTVQEQLADVQKALKTGVMQTPTMPGFTPQRTAALQSTEQELRFQVDDQAAEAWYKAMRAGANEAQNAAVALAGQTSEYAKIRKLNEEIVALGKAKTGDATLDRDIQRTIYDKQKQIQQVQLGMGAEGKALSDERIANELKLSEIQNKGAVAEVDFLLKIGLLSQAEANRRKTEAALALNEAQQLATRQTIAHGNITIQTRQQLQDKLAQQKLEHDLIEVAGQYTAELTKQAELNQRALQVYKEAEDSNAALTLILRDQGLKQQALNKSIDAQVEAEQFQLEIIGQTKDQVTVLTALHKLKLDYQKAGLAAEGEMWEMDKRRVQAASEAVAAAQRADEVRKNSEKEWSRIWTSFESTGKQVFNILAQGGTDMAKRIGAAIKSSIVDLLYQLTVRKWILSVAVSMGIPGAATAASTAGLTGAGGIGNLIGGGSNILSLLGGGAGYQAGVSGAAIASSTFDGVGLSMGEAAGAAMAETFGSTIATAIPYVGWAIAAAGILKSMGVFGGSGTYAQTTGYRMAGAVGPSGFSGTSYALAENDGTQYADVIGSPATSSAWAAAVSIAMAPISRQISILADALGTTASGILGGTYAVDATVGLDQSAQLPAAVAAQVARQMLESLIPNLKDYQQQNETLDATIVRLIADVQTVKAVFDALGKTLPVTVAASEQLVAAFGGLSNLQNQFQTYYNAFYTDAEKLALTQKQVADSFRSLGIAAPQTREQFKALVGGLDLTTSSGALLFKALMDIAPAFDQITQAATLTTEAATATAAALDSARSAVWSAYDTEVDKLRALASQMGSFGKSLLDLRASLLIGPQSPLAPMQQFAEAQSQFREIAAKARLGDADALAALSGASQTYLSAGRTAFASGNDYTAIFNEVRSALGAAGETATRTADNATAQIALLQSQVEQLVGIRSAVQTLADAMATFSTQFVESLYSSLLGRASDPTGLAGWTAMLNAGASPATITSGFTGSQEYLQRTASLGSPAATTPPSTYGDIAALKSQGAAWVLQTGVDYPSIEAWTKISNAVRGAGMTLNGLDAMIGWVPGYSKSVLEGLGLPTFKSGGLAQGWSIVGDGGGPELVNFSSPGRVYTAADTRAALASGDGALLTEVKALRAEVARLAEIIQAGDIANVRETRASGERSATAVRDVAWRQSIQPKGA